MRKIGYTAELVQLIDRMIEESEMRRIDIEGVSAVVERMDKIGELGDGVSLAASRKIGSRMNDTEFDDLSISRNNAIH
jgi:hypothetical protein